MQPITKKGGKIMKASDVMKRLSSGEMISILKEIYSEKLDEQILRYRSPAWTCTCICYSVRFYCDNCETRTLCKSNL